MTILRRYSSLRIFVADTNGRRTTCWMEGVFVFGQMVAHMNVQCFVANAFYLSYSYLLKKDELIISKLCAGRCTSCLCTTHRGRCPLLSVFLTRHILQSIKCHEEKLQRRNVCYGDEETAINQPATFVLVMKCLATKCLATNRYTRTAKVIPTGNKGAKILR